MKKFMGRTAAVLLIVLICVFSGSCGNKTPEDGETPTLSVERVIVSDREDFTVDVTVSSLGEVLYPAASMSISFDATLFEFIGVEEGNLFVYSGNSQGKDLPEWSYNADSCNESGIVNVMYLDMTGGKNAFSKDLLSEGGDVVLRLKFRPRGSVDSGDGCSLVIEDAVFAASDESQSLATTTGTLAVQNGTVVARFGITVE